MISPRVQVNLQNAKAYFREHLCQGEYYAKSQSVTGEWFGLGAEKLGLKGAVGEKEFIALCEGLHPITGECLTARLNSVRWEYGKNVANRRIFYDFTISPPKSVSVVALCQDARIIGLHDRTVRVAMRELETFSQTRVRKSGQNTTRATGNLIGAAFRHDTSRELDPHLHTHCVVLNGTFDPIENRWKALETVEMYRAQKLAENLYYHEMAKGLVSLGYEIENRGHAFEIKGVPESLRQRFSKRHAQINLQAQELMKREGLWGNEKDLREQVAHNGRRPKTKGATAERLRPSWFKQMTVDEGKALETLRHVTPRLVLQCADAASIVAWAHEHLFERRSVVQDYELLSTALAHGRGQGFELADLVQAVAARDYVREQGTRKLTSQAALRCELNVVMAAKNGRGGHATLNPNYQPPPNLSAEQAAAVKQILGSRDFITLFRGGAGTGKSFALKEVECGLVAAKHPVVVLAPQRQQVQDLQTDGLPAETLALFLEKKQLPHGAVVIVDEAGQIGARQLYQLIMVVQANRGRIVLSGDTRQHGAVQASDALLAIEKYSGLRAAEVHEIRRQDPARAKSTEERAFVTDYRNAVYAASSRRIAESFNILDKLGCIREVAQDERRAVLAKEYLTSLDRCERVLVVAQTWTEVNGVNEAIRAELQASGRIGPGVKLKTYQVVDLSEAQKQDARFYEPGQFACMLRRYGRFKKGELCPIAGTKEHGLVLIKDGRRSTMSYQYANRVAVAAEKEIEVAPGDRLQLKFNGKSKEGHSIANGELVTVRRINADGSLKVEDARLRVKTLSPQQRMFNRGYAVTSYASQGKTVDTVLVADAGCRAATSSNQWYVAISRGRKRVIVFTDNKAELRASIEQSGERELALDLKVAAKAHRAQMAFRRDVQYIHQMRRHQAIMHHSGIGQRRGISM
jgi:conjugative relaxase-like TrwC/TraI family protein